MFPPELRAASRHRIKPLEVAQLQEEEQGPPTAVLPRERCSISEQTHDRSAAGVAVGGLPTPALVLVVKQQIGAKGSSSWRAMVHGPRDKG